MAKTSTPITCPWETLWEVYALIMGAGILINRRTGRPYVTPPDRKYKNIKLPGGQMKNLHQVIYYMATGENLKPGYEINHIDENTHNNSITNLEQVPRCINKVHSDKARGIVYRTYNRWRGRITYCEDGVRHTYGKSFDTEEEARAWAEAESKRRYGR